MASARSGGMVSSHSCSSRSISTVNLVAHVDAQLAPDVAVYEEAVCPSAARRKIGAVRLAPYPALDADVGLAAERIADLRGNVDAAVHADGIELRAEAVSGHVRLLA